ncbi:MAG: AMP-binding protein [Phycisphaera sp.]|nr:AMP-binding protein [Phycisphaera sp.]
MSNSRFTAEDSQITGDAVAECWESFVDGRDGDIDLRVLGASSLDLLRFELELRRRTGRAVSLEKIDGPVTLASIRGAVASATPVEESSPPDGADSIEAPATAAQSAQWLAERLRPLHRGYLVPIVIELPAGTTWRMMSEALTGIVRRHPAMRTTVKPRDDDPGELRQVVGPPPGLVVVEPRSLPGLDDDSIAMVIDGLGNSVPAVTSGRPWRALGLQVGGRLEALLLLVHHVMVDDPSIRILVRDLHRGLVRDGDPGLDSDRTEISRRDLLQQGRGEAGFEPTDTDFEWWRDLLAGVPDHLDLAAGRTCSTASRRRTAMIGESEIAALDARLIDQGAVRSAVILRAARRALGKIGIGDDAALPIGVPVSLRDHPALEETVGMFLNTLPVPVSPDDRLPEISAAIRDCRRRRRIPYETIAREVPGGTLARTGRSRWLDLVVGTLEADRGDPEPLVHRVAPSGDSPFPIMLTARFERVGCRLELDVDPELISDADADEFLAAVAAEIRSTTTGSRSEGATSKISGPIPEEEPGLLHDLVARSAQSTPDAIAIEDDRGTLTYLEFQSRVDALVTTILEAAGDDSRPLRAPVAIAGDPGADLCTAVVAAMRAGGAAMPLAGGTPASRIATILSRSRPAVVLVTEERERPSVDEALAIAGLDVPVVVVAARRSSGARIELDVDPSDACYLLFTSGSTGEPKAVRMHHGGLAGLVAHDRRRLAENGVVRTAQYAPIGFDVSFQEMFTTWAAGGTLIPVPVGVRRDPHALARFLNEGAIERLHLPPLVLRALATACPGGFPESLREIVCAGEALRIDDTVRRAASSTTVRILNQYGPTETHVVTEHDLGTSPDGWPDLPSIGSPIEGVDMRIESADGSLVEGGKAGELVVQGAAVALGYLDGDDGGFVSPEAGVRRYRTGDRARIGDDGAIEYLGRQDQQVKISGYRVDPAEIEAALGQLDEIVDSAVITVPRDDLRDGLELVAFVVGPTDSRDLESCLDSLRNRLPAWLVPARIRSMAVLPRSANGKVDRAVLRRQASNRPSAGHRFGSGWTAGDVMQRLEIESDDHDVDAPIGGLGIDSLGAIRLQEEIAKRFEIDVPIAEILETTIAGLRHRILDGTGAGRSRRHRSSEVEVEVEVEGSRLDEDASDWRPLDPLVRDVLAEDALAPEGAFHLAWTIEFLEGCPVEEVARRLLLARRGYQTLRTCRRPEMGERVLGPGEAGAIDLDVFEEPPGEEDRRRILRHPLRLADGMPWRAATWVEPDGRRVLLLVIHHAAVDGRTARSIIDEIVSGEAVERNTASVRSVLAVRDDHEQWWADRIRNTIGDDSLPMIGFEDADRRLIAFDGHGGDVFRSSAEQAARHGMPPIAPALLAWGLVLGRAAGRTKVVVGVPFATELDDSGLGASILPVAIRIDDHLSVRDALREVASTIAGGLDHRGATLGRIVRKLAPDTAFTRPPLDGVITRDDVERRCDDATIRWTSTGAGIFRAGFVVPASDEGLSTAIDIEDGVLDGESPEDLLARVMSTTSEIVAHLRDPDGMSGTIGEIDGLTPRQRRRLTAFGTGDLVEVGSEPDDGTVTARFEDVAASNPDRIAIIDRDDSVTYAELSSWSAAIAETLAARCGSVVGKSVAVTGPRSAATIASMLGIVRAGGWFVPLDPDLPDDRRRQQLAAAAPVAVLAIDDDSTDIGVSIDPSSLRDAPPSEACLPRVDGDSPFYAMFTSGTTGEPRGALIPHRAVHRLVDDAWFLPAGPGLRMLHAAPLAFDASTLEIWWPLLNAGTICCWEGSAADLPGLQARMQRDEVEGCWLTAALFHAAVDGYPALFTGLDVLLTGGDVVSPDHVRRLLEQRPDLAIVDGYGPTENTVFTACESIVAGGSARGSIPVGRPVRGTSLRIVDPGGHDVPPGRFGELVATGDGVGLGYLGIGGIAEHRDGFRLDSESGTLGYHTGDRVRWRPDGRLDFGGRYDSQVKIAGRRIELAAIETVLRRAEGVTDACVVIVKSGERRSIGGLIVPEADCDGVSAIVDRVRSLVAGQLPAWEVPSVLQAADSIPTTKNGKPDRGEVVRILETDLEQPPAKIIAPRQDELLTVVCGAITAIAGRPVSDPKQSIRDLGVDSLDLLRLAIELENRVARPVRLVDVLEGGSAAAITMRIADDIDREDAEIVTLQPGSAGPSRTLFCVPGVGGTVFSFQAILDGLPSWLPVKGLPYPGTAGRVAPIKRVEQIARLFAERMRHDGSPPSAILGYSLGGFVAFETARILLEEHGVECPVIVIDSAPAGLPSRKSFAARVTSASDWKMRFRNVLPAGILDRLGGGGTALQSLRGVVAAGFEAMRFYSPAPGTIDVVLIRTTETDFGPVAGIPDLGWAEIARQVEILEIPTAHLEVFRGGSMDLARSVRAVVERRRARG